MSLLNYLGTFDTLTAAWEAYPEGGKEGDYIIIGEEYYKWDKYSSSWSLSAYIPKEAKVAEEDYFTPTKDISEDIVDIPDNTNVYLNFLGYFSTLNEAWEVYPEGGKEGDYIIIAEQRLWWNKYTQEWDNTITSSSDITDVETNITLPFACVNALGKFDSIADAWQKHPEGGKEGDYIQIAEDIYKWDKYLTAWINIENLPSSERLPIVPTFTEDAVDYSDGYINYLGTFESLEQVWLAYPEGGKEGDYVIVEGERYRWNKLTNNWGEVDPDAETPARPIVSIYGDLHVHHDTVIGEKLYAEILKTFTTKRWVLEQGYIGNKDITPTLIMSNIVPDNVTIGIKDGKLVVIGGGTADSISWEDITNKPSWLEGEEGFVTISSEQTIRAHKNFEKGISVQGAPISYDAVKKVWIFDANMLVTGGFAWNSSIDGFKPETITDAVIVDGITLGRTPEGALCVIGDIGGLDEEALQEYLDFNKYVTTNYVKDNYIAINGDQDVAGIKNFANGLKIGNALITYNAEKNAFILPANLLVEGGIAWNSSIDGFKPQTITDAVVVDGVTIGKDETTGALKVIGDIGGGLDEEALQEYLDFNKYATIPQIEDKLQGYATISVVNELSDSVDDLSNDLKDFLEGSDTDSIINKWKELETFLSGLSESDNLAEILQGKANKADTLKGYGITDAYTKLESESKFIDFTSNQDVAGVKNFTNGLEINGFKIFYDSEKNALVVKGNLLVEKGIAWNSSIEGFEPKTITDAVMIDDNTLGRNESGEIYVKGGAGGGGSIKYPLSWSGYSQGVWDGSASANIVIPSLMSQLTNDEGYIKDVSSDMIVAALGYTPYNSTNPNGYITSSALTPYATTASVNSLLTDYALKSAIPSKLSQLTDDVVDGKYLPLTGGTVGGNITATTFLSTGNTAIQFPDGEYIDRYGNIVLPSTASQWSVKNSNMMLLAVRNDGEIQINGTIHFTKEVPMIKMVENGWAQSKVMWHSWDSTEGDSLWLQIPSGVENDAYFKLCRLAPSILNTSLQVNGNLLATGEITQHSSLVLKDVIDTRFLTLKELAKLKPYSFYWKDKRDDKLHAGAVADYVMPILPEVISTDKDNIHSMNYANAAWVVSTSLTPYVSKHEEEIARLKARVKYLEDKLKEC